MNVSEYLVLCEVYWPKNYLERGGVLLLERGGCCFFNSQSERTRMQQARNRADYLGRAYGQHAHPPR